MGEVYLLGLGTALPRYAVGTGQVAHFLSQVARARGASPSITAKLARLIKSSGINQRHSVLADYRQEDPGAFTFFPKNWALEPLPTTGARMDVYRDEAPRLGAVAAERALARAGVDPRRVTHLVLTSCTGFVAPGPDVALVERLGLSASVERTIIGFMGCYAGLTGMRVSEQIVRADPQAVVLEVAVELSSLHVQPKTELRDTLPNLLFGDGAGAAVYGAERPGRTRVLGAGSQLVPEHQAAMTWTIGDHGFHMHLAPEVPEAIEAETGAFVDRLLGRRGLARASVAGWAIHPGGRRIVAAAGQALGLDPSALTASLETLRDVGNVSSATIFFVLERLQQAQVRGVVVGLAFGPGLTLEGALLDLG